MSSTDIIFVPPESAIQSAFDILSRIEDMARVALGDMESDDRAPDSAISFS